MAAGAVKNEATLLRLKLKGRRSSKRSRAGCLTCKLRKVKCDETKPECNRCRIFGTKCDGYGTPLSRLRTVRKPLLPVRMLSYKASLAPSPSTSLKFESETEERHFRTFQSETAYEIAGIFESVFWQRLVLQECHKEDFVLDAVLALSAYNTSLKLSKPDSGLQDETCVAIAAEQTQFALRKYQKSLHVMRISLNKIPSPRTALIACLLVCSFEGLLGNSLTALAHARSGQTLVEDFLAEHPHPNPEDEGLASPAPHIIEDKLLQAAVYFETQIIGFFDQRSADEHARLKLFGQEGVAKLPRTFRDLEEARTYWELISGRVAHFICECSAVSAPYSDNERNEWTLGTDLPKAVDTSGITKKVHQLDCYQLEKTRYLEEITRWYSAFGDLYSKLKRISNKRLIMGAHTLYVKSKSMEMSIGTVLDRSVCSHDKYFTHFREIVAICQDLIQMKRCLSKAEFSVELGIIPSLHMTAKWCRERVTRREAIRLLYWYGAREGHWDSRAMADINSCVMELEEEGSDTDYIPECARVTVVSIDTEEIGWATINFVRGSSRTGEFPGAKRIRWPGEVRDVREKAESVESELDASAYGDRRPASVELSDDSLSSDELYSSGFCSSPQGFLFQNVQNI